MSEKRIAVQRWCELANGDLEAAKHLLSLHPLRLEVICYLCEQSTEKFLKGFLVAVDIEPPRTHDLNSLCRMCLEYDDAFNEIIEPCARLTPYAVQVRYPNNVEVFEEDMKLALRDAEKASEFISQKLEALI